MSFPQVISKLLLQNFGPHSVKSRLRPLMDIPSLLHFSGRFQQHDIYEELDLRGLLDHNLFVCWYFGQKILMETFVISNRVQR